MNAVFVQTSNNFMILLNILEIIDIDQRQ